MVWLPCKRPSMVILNPGSLSSEDFLIWACLIEKGSSYLQLSGPAQMLQQML